MSKTDIMETGDFRRRKMLVAFNRHYLGRLNCFFVDCNIDGCPFKHNYKCGEVAQITRAVAFVYGHCDDIGSIVVSIFTLSLEEKARVLSSPEAMHAYVSFLFSYGVLSSDKAPGGVKLASLMNQHIKC